MGLIIKRYDINNFLINAFAFVCVIFPGDIYNLKKILFFVICIFNAQLILSSLVSRKNDTLVFFGFVFPTLLFIYSAIMTKDIMVSFLRSFSAYMFLVIFVVKAYKIDFEKILLKYIKLISIATVLLVALDLIGIINVNTGFFRNEIMYGYGIGLMGKASTYPLFYKVFFRTSPLIVFLLLKSFNESKYFVTIIALTALIVSGTRANALFPLFFLVAFYIFSSRNRSNLIKYTFIVFSFMIIMLFTKPIVEILNETLIVKGQYSDTIRQGHIEGIKELVDNDPWIILTGSGMGSEFYSYGSNSYVSAIEWSYIDLWRQMGLLFFLLFLLFISLPLLYKKRGINYKKYAYIAYLLIAATNPLLFSSTSYLAYIYMYYNTSDNHVIEENKR